VNLPPQISALPAPTGPTPAQTVGPFFRFGLAWMDARDLVGPGADDAVVLTGHILDGAGAPVPDAVVEIWQADARGGLGEAGPVAPGTWSGFGRALTDADGHYRFTTVAPGRVDALQAPHIDMTIFARGLLQRLVTRVYLPDHAANDADPVLAALPSERRATLVAAIAPGDRATDGDPVLRFDVRLQGDKETVFFVW
jgi:protocatechuate 3,4-dioxygenase alpha subunit